MKRKPRIYYSDSQKALIVDIAVCVPVDVSMEVVSDVAMYCSVYEAGSANRIRSESEYDLDYPFSKAGS
jgi:N-acetyl-gamma-glutamylphosphate reductase